jgi:hypothetical protein
MPPGSIIRYLFQGNNPPAYELILHFWIRVFGISEWSVRLPSVLFSSVTALLIYCTGKRFYRYEAGLLASLLFTCSNFNLLMAHEARSYALLSLLSCGSMYWFFRTIQKKTSSGSYAVLAVLNIFLVTVHYCGVFIILVQCALVLLFPSIRKSHFKAYGVYLMALFLLTLPLISILLKRYSDTCLHGSWVPIPQGPGSIYNLFRTYSNQPVVTLLSLIVLFAAPVWLLVMKKSPDGRFWQMLLIWLWLPLLFIFFFSFRLSFFMDRYLIFVFPAFYLLLGIFSFKIFSRKKYALWVGGILLACYAATCNPNPDNKRHIREAILKVKSLMTPEAKVMICPSYLDLNFAYYYKKDFFAQYDLKQDDNRVIQCLQQDGIFPVYAMDPDLLQYKRIIYLDGSANSVIPDNKIQETLETFYKAKRIFYYPEIFRVYEYERKNNQPAGK